MYFFCGAAAQRHLWPPHIHEVSRSHTTVGLLWTSD